MPSIVVGLFGYLVFLVFMGMGKSLLAGALSVSILTLPLITTTTEDAIRGLPEGVFPGKPGDGRHEMAVRFPCVAAGLCAENHDRCHPGGGKRIWRGGSPSVYNGIRHGAELGKLGYNLPTSPLNLLRPAETLSIQIWNLQVNGQDRDLANLASAVLMILVLIFNITANAWSRRIQAKNSGSKE